MCGKSLFDAWPMQVWDYRMPNSNQVISGSEDFFLSPYHIIDVILVTFHLRFPPDCSMSGADAPTMLSTESWLAKCKGSAAPVWVWAFSAWDQAETCPQPGGSGNEEKAPGRNGAREAGSCEGRDTWLVIQAAIKSQVKHVEKNNFPLNRAMLFMGTQGWSVTTAETHLSCAVLVEAI